MFAFCPPSCQQEGEDTNSKWIEFNGKIYRTSDVSIGSNVFPSKFNVDGNVDVTGNIQINNFYYLGNVALCDGLPVNETSKWNESGGNIFRDSLVTINSNSVNTNNDLFVNGNANVSLGVETPFGLVSGNVDPRVLNVSGVVDASYFKGDAGGIGNCVGGVGSRWIENISGNIYVIKNVSINFSNPFERLAVLGNIVLENYDNVKMFNDSEIIFNSRQPITPPFPFPSIPGSSNTIKIQNAFDNSSALQVGGTSGILDTGNYISKNEIHTSEGSALTHFFGTQQNIKFAILDIKLNFTFTTVINTIDRDFTVVEIPSGITEKAFRIASQGSLPNDKNVFIQTQITGRNGFGYATVAETDVKTFDNKIQFDIQTGDFTSFGPSVLTGMTKQPESFFCLIMLNDF